MLTGKLYMMVDIIYDAHELSITSQFTGIDENMYIILEHMIDYQCYKYY